jgi:protein tolA
LDDFFNGGDVGGGSATQGGNANKTGSQGSGASMGAGDGGKTGSAYAGVIYSSVKPYFRGDTRFIGKVCDIRMELASDGTILSYAKKSGPNDLCAAALNAIEQTKKMRRAPTPEEYEMFKSFTLGFDPRKVR